MRFPAPAAPQQRSLRKALEAPNKDFHKRRSTCSRRGLWGSPRWLPDPRIPCQGTFDPKRIRPLSDLGAGTFGEVVKVECDGRAYAVKRMRRGNCPNSTAVCFAMFMTEAEVLVRMDGNEFFPKLYGAFYNETARYIVMDCGTRSFVDRIVTDRRSGLFYGRQLVAAVSSMHHRGIIHLDLKPDNLVLGPTNKLMVIDFGFSQVFRPTDAEDWPEWHAQLRSDDFTLWPERYNPDTLDYYAGTHYFMSPLVQSRRRYSYCADLWSVGMILHLWIVGLKPTLEFGYYVPPSDLSMAEFDFFHRIFSCEVGTRPPVICHFWTPTRYPLTYLRLISRPHTQPVCSSESRALLDACIRPTKMDRPTHDVPAPPRGRYEAALRARPRAADGGEQHSARIEPGDDLWGHTWAVLGSAGAAEARRDGARDELYLHGRLCGSRSLQPRNGIVAAGHESSVPRSCNPPPRQPRKPTNHPSLWLLADECQQKYGSATVWKACCNVFDFLNIAAIIDGETLCVHGGLSPDIRTLDQIRVLSRAQEIPHEGAFCDLMWSDPEEVDNWAVSPRGAGWLFGGSVTREFNHVNSLRLIARAHQLVNEGYKHMFDDQLVTVWSAPNYCYRCGNMAAILTITETGESQFTVYGAAEENERDKGMQTRRMNTVPYFV
uniref:protein-serine/threonine phosphatase n=1 Tax=Mycena chlorophos TaxID=658473 RepID=A0ABQ0M482_MYCCL|nr:predicted protein [Mycena chlorophos]